MERKDYFNKISGMEVVPYSENSSAGAKLKSSYEKEVFIDFVVKESDRERFLFVESINLPATTRRMLLSSSLLVGTMARLRTGQ